MAEQFAVVTGASTGIGYELARCCAAQGFDMLVAADEPQIAEAARETHQAVYNGTKAFLDSFSFARRHEIAESGVTVTCRMPGATETEFFERADMMDTNVGQAKKDDAAEVAKQGFDVMMEGKGQVITGWQNKLQAAIAHLAPSDMLAEMHRRKAEPGSARH